MNRPARSIEIFTMSALDLFVTAMGSFAILMMILFPYYNSAKKKAGAGEEAPITQDSSDPDGSGTTPEVKGDVLFCIWPTRVQDYEKFVEETGYDGTYEDFNLAPENLMPGDAWRHPGFPQEPTHPVVGVSWVDARAFCRWLTQKERKSGQIGPQDEYRLPTSDEWTAAAERGKYPWGDQWPLPEKSGNLSGAEFAVPLGYAAVGNAGYDDGYAFTSPVGSFTENRYGLFDMAGNVQQLCLDFYRDEMNSAEVRQAVPYLKDGVPPKAFRAVRGSSWQLGFEPKLRNSYHDYEGQWGRSDYVGFRCVLVVRSRPKNP